MATADPSPLARYASHAIKELVHELTSQLEGAADAEDVEFVHRSRVASRRLRAALVIFDGCFPKKKAGEWTKGVKRVTKAFGNARDLDVQIIFLQEYIAPRPSSLELQDLLDGLKAKRKEAQKGVVNAIERFTDDDIALKMLDGLSEEEYRPDDIHEIKMAGHGQAQERIAEVMSWEKFVPKPEAILEHHQMRIAGKRLRYTAEIFSPAYDDDLKPFIKRLKEMQDVLGEMHDCDVWIEMLSKGADGDIGELRHDRMSRRAELHERFVLLWGEMRQVLDDLEKAMRPISNVPLAEDIKGPLIGIISDVHGNLPALNAVMADAREEGITEFLSAGDNIGFGPFTNEALMALRAGRVVSIQGNVDRDVLRYRSEGIPAKAPEEGKVLAVHLAAKDLNGDAEAYLRSLPEERRMVIAGRRVLITHASPGTTGEKVTDATTEVRLQELASMAEADIVIFGHSHSFMDREANGVRFINPGGVGRQVDGDPRASYTVWNLAEGIVQNRRVPYRLHELAEEVAGKGWPREMVLPHVSALPSGVTEPVMELDRQDCLTACEAAAGRHGQWDAHSQHVRKLSRILFKKLESLHGMDDTDLLVLECAATMHDVGWAWGGQGHHRSSFDLITMERLPMPSELKLRAAIMARYHRGSGPKKGHGLIELLPKEDARRTLMSIALLRVADGLDYGHGQVAEIGSIKKGEEKITIVLKDPAQCIAEVQASLRKSDIFQRVLGLRLEFA
ncbi:MAG: phosphodiesterase [Methanomassiliicoccales archaeon PtaU1.Bin124]|nr:MAG: phosphodiesterase [Methanomassiliicoccales archaeon PtaU1.Bin124]